MQIIEKEEHFILQTYKRLAINVSKAVGCTIYDQNGNEYTDFLAGIAVNALGHSHPAIIEAVCDQAKRYMHLSNYFYQKPQVEMAESLIKTSGCDKVFFTNSGTEAVEGALKIVRRWGKRNSKQEIIAFTGGFHGRSYGALSIMDKPHYKKDMEPFLPDIGISEYNNISSLENTIDNTTAAVVLEFIQGEGGIMVANKDFVEKIFELKDKYNFLIVADEIQTGAGRTGKFFAFNHYNVMPDIITMAKGIGGGLPLGAILVTKDLADIFEVGMHGSTYGGNALACASGKVVLDYLNKGLLDDVQYMGAILSTTLNEMKEKFPSIIKEVRGLGLMQGLLLSFDASILVERLLRHKIITNAASGNVLRLVPPLIISEMEIEKLKSALIKSINELVSENKV